MRLPWRQLMGFQASSFGAAAGSAASHGPFRQEQVRVRLSPAFNRCAHPDADLESSIDAAWRAYKEQSPRLFNATKFRLHGWHSVAPAAAANARSSPQAGAALVLDWGLTDYKTYLGTCCSVNASRFVADSQALSSSSDAFAYLSRKVGVAAVVETSDAKIALIKRSKSVGVYQDMYDTPGGHPEPSHINLTTEALSALPSIELANTVGASAEDESALEREVVREFFASIVNEVHEEINVAPTDLSAPPLLLGVVLQAEACTPSFSFYLRTALSAAEVMALYRAGPADVFESSKLELIDAQTLLVNDAHAALTGRLTPSAQGSLELWRAYALQQQQLQR